MELVLARTSFAIALAREDFLGFWSNLALKYLFSLRLKHDLSPTAQAKAWMGPI